MDIKLESKDFNEIVKKFKGKYRVLAPVTLCGKGTFSDTNSVKYKEINNIEETLYTCK